MSTNASHPPSSHPPDRERLLADVRRVVIKLGTNVLTRENGEMAMGRTHGLIEDIVDLYREGLEIIVVSSGAISLGMDRLGLKQKPADLPGLQANAAIGQIRLMSVYEQAFDRFGITTAQVLLTEDDFANRKRFLNLRNTLEHLLALRAIPIVNENDTVSTSEIESTFESEGQAALSNKVFGDRVFGDNDRLSAQVMSKLDAQLLVLLSDVDGLYPEAPRSETESPDAAGSDQPLPFVSEITPEIEAMARRGNSRGRGGMTSKLQSIKIALEAGGVAVIANGLRAGTLQRVIAGDEVGTVFLPKRRLASNKRWLAHAAMPAGRVVVNAGAGEALVKRRSSLLLAGVIRIEGDFREGDIVVVVTEDGKEIGRGRTNYDTQNALPLLGKRSDEIRKITGAAATELIHRDHIVILA